MQRLDRSGPTARSWNNDRNQPNTRIAVNDNVDVEAVALGKSSHNKIVTDRLSSLRISQDGKSSTLSAKSSISENNESVSALKADIRFGSSVKFTVPLSRNDGGKGGDKKNWNPRSDENNRGGLSWLDVKEQARKHPSVLEHFKQNATKNLSPEDFSLVVSTGREELLITPGSYMENRSALATAEKEAKNNVGNSAVSSADSGNWRQKSRLPTEAKPIQVLLLYAPRIHLCTYDGLRISLPSLGHWLHIHDTKGQSKLVNSTNAPTNNVNDLLLYKENRSLLCQFLARLNKFLRSEMNLEANEYAVCMPFGNFKSELGSNDQLRARVQLANPKIFWSLLVNFEDRLSRDKDMDIQYLAHQRDTWTTLRFNDYRRWSILDSNAVRQEYDALLNHRSINHRVSIPNEFYFDGNRMQIHYDARESLDTMHGAMGSVSSSLRELVDNYQLLANRIGTRDFHLIIHGRASHFALSPKRYMQILASSGVDALEWGDRILETLSTTPERLFSGLLAEGAGLLQCDAQALAGAVSGNDLPLPNDVLNSLKERNKVDRRVRLDVISKASTAATKTIPGSQSSYDSNTSWRSSGYGYKNNGPSRSHYNQQQSGYNSQQGSYNSYNNPADNQNYRAHSYPGYNDMMSRRSDGNRTPTLDGNRTPTNDRSNYVTSPINSPPRRQESWEDMVDPDAEDSYRPMNSYGGGMTQSGRSGYSNSSSDKSSAPGPGYVCRICGQHGGTPESHWFQQCPLAEEGPMGGVTNSRGGNDMSGNKRPPGLGYACKICGMKGGTPDSHWVQQCPEAVNDNDRNTSSSGGGFGEFWKDRSPSTPNWSF